MGELICRYFNHKWRWYKQDTPKSPYERCCSRCGILQRRKWHMTSYIWMTPIEYTKVGAKLNIPDCDDPA